MLFLLLSLLFFYSYSEDQKAHQHLDFIHQIHKVATITLHHLEGPMIQSTKRVQTLFQKKKKKRRRDREIDFLTTGWTYGTARFKGKSPSRCLDRGGVMIWYNGELNQKTSIGTTEVYEATGDICVVFPKNYRGRDIQFYSTNGIVQIQSL